eukprot:TRINITY_DN32264_c0_g1_i1.p2 TRINITY_DN32264_c0_g1~~TRINITY_DN32264_c0_g1_i1.p2  ORF type:complete len:103 (-),score=6.48 TRINITY_DN32264_c0_g1_i1:67-375(-)
MISVKLTPLFGKTWREIRRISYLKDGENIFVSGEPEERSDLEMKVIEKFPWYQTEKYITRDEQSKLKCKRKNRVHSNNPSFDQEYDKAPQKQQDERKPLRIL